MHPRIKKSSISLLKLPPFPLSAIDLWHFIMEAGPLQPNRQSGQAASDSLTVCLNSGWRLCFHSPGQTPSAKAAQLPRLYLLSMSGVYTHWCSNPYVCMFGSVCLYTHTHTLTSNQQWQTSFPVCKEMRLTWKGKLAVIWFIPGCSHACTHTHSHLTPKGAVSSCLMHAVVLTAHKRVRIRSTDNHCVENTHLWQ